MLKPSIKLKDESDQNPLNPMVIIVHVLRRYLREIAKKPKFVIDDFFQRSRAAVNRSLRENKGNEDLATFIGFVELLHSKHPGLARGIASSNRMRESERRAFKKIYEFDGSEEQVQQLLKMLNGIKRDEVFRKRIDRLISLMNINQPVGSITPPKFLVFLTSLMTKQNEFNRLILHIFEKAAGSQRMARLLATIFLALSAEKNDEILKNIFPDLLSVENNKNSFANVFAAIFLARDSGEEELHHVRRISRLFRLDLKSDIFLKEFRLLPPNKLKPAGHELEVFMKTLINKYPDFLHLLTQQIFIDSPGDILPRIPLDLVRRGLMAIYNYSAKQADDYLAKFTASITYYYEKYLPPDQRENPHFFLMISALARYVRELLEAVYEKRIFRDSEVDTWLPLLDAIRFFHESDNKTEKAMEIWDILLPIRQKKEVRDQLTLMNKLTDVASAAYFKDFIPYIKQLTTNKERFKAIFDHVFEQTRLDREKYASTVNWHVNLLDNMIRYLCDISIISDRETLPILNRLILGWLYIYPTYIFELIGLLSEQNLTTIRSLINYLYTHFPDTLVSVIQSMVRLNSEEHRDTAAGYIQYIHTSLLEQARVPGMSASDTQQEIENVKQLFEKCCTGLGELKDHWDKYIFSDAYKMSISNLLKVEVKEEVESYDEIAASNLPLLIQTLISQSSKIFNIPNFASRATNNFSEILEWALDEMQNFPTDSASLLNNISTLFGLFTQRYRFSQVSSNSVFHNFAYKNEFDYFSFAFIVYATAKMLEWEEILFRNAWREVTVTVNIGAEDLELKKNVIVNSTAMINTKSRFYKNLDQLFTPLKAETAIEVFFHLKNGIALADTRRYRLATISLEKALALHKTNIYAHYWRAMALKKAKINIEQYENHITVIEKYYPNSNEVENLKKTAF